MAAQTLGVIYGNRDFFPDVLISEARKDIAKLFADYNITKGRVWILVLIWTLLAPFTFYHL